MTHVEWLHCMYHEALQIHAPWCPALSWEAPKPCECNEKEMGR